MRIVSDMQIKQFIEDCRANGISNFFVTDRKIAMELRGRGVRHSRKGTFTKEFPKSIRDEAEGIKLHAWGCDEIGNVVALTNRGIQQFI